MTHSMKFLPAAVSLAGGTIYSDDQTTVYEYADLPEYEITVIYSGTLDEQLTIKTDRILAAFDAICADCKTEYANDPTSAWGWSVEVAQVPHHDGDEPYLINRYDPAPE